MNDLDKKRALVSITLFYLTSCGGDLNNCMFHNKRRTSENLPYADSVFITATALQSLLTDLFFKVCG